MLPNAPVNLPSLAEADGMVNKQGKRAPTWFHRMELTTQINELTTPSKLALDVCGTYDTTATRGAGSGYAWCNAALKDAVQDRKVSDKAIGLSFGADTWDQWSKTLANDYNMYTVLFDCFARLETYNNFGAQYKTPYLRYETCLGPQTEWKQYSFGTQGGHRALHFTDWKDTLKSAGLANAPPMSLIVKIDTEGSEWETLEQMSDFELNRILLLDMEIHWCLAKHDNILGNIYKRRIEKQIARLHQLFYVTGRFASTPTVYQQPGCFNYGSIYTDEAMMSVSFDGIV
jgi:hypothetical protein